jgi:hypothetical protein
MSLNLLDVFVAAVVAVSVVLSVMKGFVREILGLVSLVAAFLLGAWLYQPAAALFRFRPSPFCVLDEVDAPLDEANVDRFAGMVREMSAQTQFIVITHSKRTMETASTLYGVTMEEPGISKIVSVKLD